MKPSRSVFVPNLEFACIGDPYIEIRVVREGGDKGSSDPRGLAHRSPGEFDAGAIRDRSRPSARLDFPLQTPNLCP